MERFMLSLTTQEADGDRPICQRIQSVVPWTPVAPRSGKIGSAATVPTSLLAINRTRRTTLIYKASSIALVCDKVEEDVVIVSVNHGAFRFAKWREEAEFQRIYVHQKIYQKGSH